MIEKGTPYDILGVAVDADERQIRAAYFKLVRLHPPESQPKRFMEIRSAYEALMSVQARAKTDVSVVQPPDFAYEFPQADVPSFFDLAPYERLLMVCRDLFVDGPALQPEADFLSFEQAYAD